MEAIVGAMSLLGIIALFTVIPYLIGTFFITISKSLREEDEFWLRWFVGFVVEIFIAIGYWVLVFIVWLGARVIEDYPWIKELFLSL
jgi:ABC-type amino acid transport system permease subunit